MTITNVITIIVIITVAVRISVRVHTLLRPIICLYMQYVNTYSHPSFYITHLITVYVRLFVDKQCARAYVYACDCCRCQRKSSLKAQLYSDLWNNTRAHITFMRTSVHPQSDLAICSYFRYGDIQVKCL